MAVLNVRSNGGQAAISWGEASEFPEMTPSRVLPVSSYDALIMNWFAPWEYRGYGSILQRKSLNQLRVCVNVGVMVEKYPK